MPQCELHITLERSVAIKVQLAFHSKAEELLDLVGQVEETALSWDSRSFGLTLKLKCRVDL